MPLPIALILGFFITWLFSRDDGFGEFPPSYNDYSDQ